MNVAIYTRVSTEDQKENGFSLQDQERRLIGHLNRFDKEVVKHYQDNCSGKNFNRPQFSKLLSDLKHGNIKIKELWCIRIDRFSRDFRETLSMTSFLKSLGVTLRFVENEIDLTTPENILPYVLNIALPQVENERRGINTKTGMRQALRSGQWVWKAPKGYINNTTNKTIEINKDSKFIRRAYNEVSKELKPLENIRKELANEGFTCSKQQFYNLLRNSFYIGKIRIEAWREEPEEIVEGNHKPIITEDLFIRVQNILSGNRRKQSKPKKNNELFPLRGHLLCSSCGNNLTASSSSGRNKKYHYYHCQNGCKERFDSVNANKDFIEHLKSLSISPSVAKLYKEIVKDVFESKEETKEKQIDKLNRSLSLIIEKSKKLDNEFLSGNIQVDDYNRMNTALKEKQADTKHKISKVEKTETNLEKYFSYGLYLLTNLDFHYENAPLEVKHKIVGSIYPKKLIYLENNYRTTESNSFVSFITSKTNELESFENKKATISSGLSNVAPPLGLEPRTL